MEMFLPIFFMLAAVIGCGVLWMKFADWVEGHSSEALGTFVWMLYPCALIAGVAAFVFSHGFPLP